MLDVKTRLDQRTGRPAWAHLPIHGTIWMPAVARASCPWVWGKPSDMGKMPMPLAPPSIGSCAPRHLTGGFPLRAPTHSRCWEKRPDGMEPIDLHTAARTGTLAAIPREELTPERLKARNAAGHTPLHLAARYGGLCDLPAETLTSDALAQKNDAGYTPLHQAAIGGHLDQVPAALLTGEALLDRSNSGYTVLPPRRGPWLPRPDSRESAHLRDRGAEDRSRQHAPA